jgi:hypothetical protein
MRYFFISYSWTNAHGTGFGNCTIENSSFPRLSTLGSWLQSTYGGQITVLNIQEMNEGDYQEFTS